MQKLILVSRLQTSPHTILRNVSKLFFHGTLSWRINRVARIRVIVAITLHRKPKLQLTIVIYDYAI